MRLSPVCAGVVAALIAAPAAWGQSTTSVEDLQATAPPRDPTSALQVGPTVAPVVPAEAPRRTRAPHADQLGPAEREPQPAGQLATAGQGRAPARQLTTESPTAEGAAPLSTPAQGRTASAEPLQGEDRCDPALSDQLSKLERARCAQILERRAAEFDRPSVREPSPEERLLGFQARAAGSIDAGDAARRLARGEVDESLAAQAAAVSAGRPADEDRGPELAEPADPQLSPAMQAFIEALGRGADGAPPTGP